METQLAYKTETQIIEQVVINGDLSRLTPQQRVSYYQAVCKSLSLNPLTRPFDYITLNGKLTLYARKDAADQLRKLHNVSIDDIDITENPTHFIVKVKGHDKTGRSDVEIGVVAKTDMAGNLGNAQMKAVTKSKRRLTLSLCGLGMLDETEIETIPTAVQTIVDEKGEIVHDAESASFDPPKDELFQEKRQPVQEEFEHIPDNGDYSKVSTDDGIPYSELKLADLVFRFNSLSKKKDRSPEDQRKLDAANYYIQKSRGAGSPA